MKITFITSNQGKIDQAQRYLSIPIVRKDIDLDEIQSLDCEQIIRHKVLQAYEIVKGPVMVDDSSLLVRNMGNLPGPFVKYFLKAIGSEGLAKLVHSYGDVSADAILAIGYYDGKEIKVFSGTIPGTIADQPMGENGFGWDNIFIPDGHSKTRGEMDQDEYDQTSPRKIALIKLQDYLKSYSH